MSAWVSACPSAGRADLHRIPCCHDAFNALPLFHGLKSDGMGNTSAALTPLTIDEKSFDTCQASTKLAFSADA